MKIIAHRGNDGIHKENTMESILNSLKLSYVDGIETDIRMTMDNNFVIAHDPFYNGLFISNTKTKKLQKEGINTLEEILEKINNKKIIMIEIKEESNNYRILNNKLYNILKKYNLNYYICSFNYELIENFKKKFPDIKTGLLIGIKMNKDKITNNFEFNVINYRHIKQASNKETFIWTIDDKETLEKVKHNQNVITDKAKFIYELSKNI